MTFLEKIRARPHILVFALFLFLHLGLFNVNRAEWGDSYRILRASEYVRDFSYPEDEKRPPLYSVFLAFRPAAEIDPVLWGRFFMLFVSILSLYLFFLVSRKIFKGDSLSVTISLLIFTFNPTYFYWSLRIYADVFFALGVLLITYLYLNWKGKMNVFRLGVLAFLSVLTALTRFEGYLVIASLGLALLFSDSSGFVCIHLEQIQDKVNSLFKNKFSINILKPLVYGGFSLLFILPYWIWRNPLDSSYFSETSEMVYDLRLVVTYVLSLLFLFGFTSAPAFFFSGIKDIWEILKEQKFMGIFLTLGLLLVLAWPAAVPRLFVPVIPFLIILLSKGISSYFAKEENQKAIFSPLWMSIYSLGFLSLYILGQRLINLQFLVPVFRWVLIIVVINFISIIFIYKKKIAPFLVTAGISILLWLFFVIYAHKDIYATIKSGAEYSVENLTQGIVAYNDSSSVTDWYLNQDPNSPPGLGGRFFDYGSSEQLSQENLGYKGFDYLIITNEHNPNLEIDFERRPYLEVLKTFEEEINGRMFFTKVVKVKN